MKKSYDIKITVEYVGDDSSELESKCIVDSPLPPSVPYWTVINAIKALHASIPIDLRNEWSMESIGFSNKPSVFEREPDKFWCIRCDKEGRVWDFDTQEYREPTEIEAGRSGLAKKRFDALSQELRDAIAAGAGCC